MDIYVVVGILETDNNGCFRIGLVHSGEVSQKFREHGPVLERCSMHMDNQVIRNSC